MTSVGRRRAETPSMNGDAESDYALAEQELSKLQREYRILKKQRKSYLEESQNIIRKQYSHITSLEDEQGKMETDLRLATSRRVYQKDSVNEGFMRTFLMTYMEYKTLCNGEKDEIRHLDKQLRLLEESVRRYNMSKVDRAEHDRSQLVTEKRTRVMENRLYWSKVTFNKALTKNSDLRARIEELRRERKLYNSLYRKMCIEQNDLKIDMNDILQKSTLAYDSRDESHNKMAALRERMEKDQNVCNIELKGLQRIVNHEEKLKAFMNLKAQDRVDQMKATAEEIQRRKDKHGQADPAEVNLKNHLELSFVRLRSATGETDLDKLVHRFIYKEGLNFALFKYVNEVNDDIEQLQEEIKKKEGDMKEFKREGKALEGERLDMMKKLERKANEKTKEANQLQNNITRVRKRLYRIMSAIMSTVHRLGCDQTTVARRLGSREGISELDALAYLGLIEQTMTEMLLIGKCSEHKTSAAVKVEEKPGNAGESGNPKASGSVLMTPRRPVPSMSVSIVPPTIRDDVDVSSSSAEVLTASDQPLTLDQVRGKVARRLQRLEAQQKRARNAATPAAGAAPAKGATPAGEKNKTQALYNKISFS